MSFQKLSLIVMNDLMPQLLKFESTGNCRGWKSINSVVELPLPFPSGCFLEITGSSENEAFFFMGRLLDAHSKPLHGDDTFYYLSDGNSINDLSETVSAVLGVFCEDEPWTPASLEAAFHELLKLEKDPNGCVAGEFLSFPAGTHIDRIYDWFDNRYPGGVHPLMERFSLTTSYASNNKKTATSCTPMRYEELYLSESQILEDLYDLLCVNPGGIKLDAFLLCLKSRLSPESMEFLDLPASLCSAASGMVLSSGHPPRKEENPGDCFGATRHSGKRDIVLRSSSDPRKASSSLIPDPAEYPRRTPNHSTARHRCTASSGIPCNPNPMDFPSGLDNTVSEPVLTAAECSRIFGPCWECRSCSDWFVSNEQFHVMLVKAVGNFLTSTVENTASKMGIEYKRPLLTKPIISACLPPLPVSDVDSISINKSCYCVYQACCKYLEKSPWFSKCHGLPKYIKVQVIYILSRLWDELDLDKTLMELLSK